MFRNLPWWPGTLSVSVLLILSLFAVELLTVAGQINFKEDEQGHLESSPDATVHLCSKKQNGGNHNGTWKVPFHLITDNQTRTFA